MVRSKKELEILLTKVPAFTAPMKKLEQYICDSSIASELLWYAYMHGDIRNRTVADLGCGTGILSYGSLILGAKDVFCVDIDCNVLSISREFVENTSHALHTCIHYICCDVRRLFLRSIDTVVMNPPFGVHSRGIDLRFLEQAFEISPSNIYSIHKYNPNSHKLITRLAHKKGYIVQLIAVGNMAIQATYEDHIRQVYRFKVSIYRFVR